MSQNKSGKSFVNSVIKYICSTHLPLAHNSLAAGVPVPQQHGAVLAAADDVAVAGVVTLRPGDTEKRIL